MNPPVGIEERQQKLPPEPKQQQKIHTSLKTNVKSLKHGIRSVMNSNIIGKQMGPMFKDKQPEKSCPEESEHMETDELNLEDLATVSRVAGDEKEESMDLNDSSVLRTSLHQKQQRGLGAQDSPRGPEWGSSVSGMTAAMSSQGIDSQSINVGSDSNLHFTQHTPMSPAAAASPEPGLKHPHSAPGPIQTLGLSPGRSSQQPIKNGKFLRGKIKISALKNFVGSGLDLGGSSNHATKNQAPRANNEEDIDFSRRQEVDDIDDDFASPQPVKGPGRKIANKMRNSIIGFKNLAKANRNAAVLLEDDATASTDPDNAKNPMGRVGEPKDNIDVADSDTNFNAPPTDSTHRVHHTTQELMDQGLAHTAVDNLLVKEEAKQRRREKHNQRRARQLDGESNHASITSSQTLDTTSSSVAGPSLHRKKTKGKLDAQARERLKKHSEGRDFRNRTTTANRRRRQQLVSKQHSDRNLDTSDATSDLPALSPTTPAKPSARPSLVRATTTETQSSRKLTEPQSGRKCNKEEDEKLRERVRSRQSFLAVNAPKKEDSFSLLELLDKKEEDDLSFADDIAESVGPTEEQEAADGDGVFEDSEESLQDVFASDKHTKSSSGRMDARRDSSAPESTGVPQGSFQHVESPRSDDYLQLIIGNVPPKASSPPPPGPEAPAAAETASPRREKKPPGRRRSGKGLGDARLDSSEIRRTKTSHRVRSEKRDASSGRKPRGEKPSRHRDRSQRRKSDSSGIRRQRGHHRSSEAGHVSEPVLGSVGLESELAATAGHTSEMENSSNMENCSRSYLDGSSTSNREGSARASEGYEGGDSAANLDASAQSNADDNDCPTTEASFDGTAAPVEPSSGPYSTSRRHEGKEFRRRHHKGGKEKRGDRKTSRSGMNGSSRHSSAAASTSKPSKLHRSTTRGRVEGGPKKPPSNRGRSEKPRRESRTQAERSSRRHSTDARKRPSNESETKMPKPDLASARELGNSLANIKW